MMRKMNSPFRGIKCEVCGKDFSSHSIRYKTESIHICHSCYLEWIEIWEKSNLHALCGKEFRKTFDILFGKFMKKKRGKYEENIIDVFTRCDVYE